MRRESMKNITLSELEVRALQSLLVRWKEACSCGCAFPEMQKSKKGCEKCDYPKAIADIEDKLGMYD